jgi:hypothetical protein
LYTDPVIIEGLNWPGVFTNTNREELDRHLRTRGRVLKERLQKTLKGKKSEVVKLKSNTAPTVHCFCRFGYYNKRSTQW